VQNIVSKCSNLLVLSAPGEPPLLTLGELELREVEERARVVVVGVGEDLLDGARVVDVAVLVELGE